MRDLVAAWLRKRLGPDSRVIFELALGDRRIDVLGVGTKDLIGIEIKSARDTLTRLPAQLDEFRRHLPEVWVAIAPRWIGRTDRWDYGNRLIVRDGIVDDVRKGKRAWRDECVCTQLLRLLWRDECARIAQRTDVIPGVMSGAPVHKIRPLLARLLTGNEIVREVCTELRARPLVGIESDGATR